MSKIVVLSSPQPGREAEFNDWYDNVHLGELLDIPGIVGATRYKSSTSGTDEPDQPPHPYLAIYEVEGDLAPVIKEIWERAGNGTMNVSEALAADTVHLWPFESL